MEEQPTPPRVTALLVSHNNATALRRAIQALEQSTARETLEILVVDTGSWDECPTLDAEFPNVVFMRLSKYFGKTKALNIGMRTAKAELIFFLAPEVEVRPDTVSLLAGKLEAAAEAVGVCPLLLDGEGNAPPQAFRLPATTDLLSIWRENTEFPRVDIDPNAERQTVELVPFQAMLVRKYFVKGLNYLDDRYGEAGADLELAFQIRRAGKKILFFPAVHATWVPTIAEVPTPAARSLLSTDRGSAYASFVGKHRGLLAGLWFRVQAAFSALAALRFGVFAGVLSGQKVDGSQTTEL